MKKIYWLTGLPSSGKSSIAKELGKHLYAEILNGDEIRELTSNVEFTKEKRTIHMTYVAAMVYYLSKHIDVVVSLVSPIRSIRNSIKGKYPNLHEIYIKCDPEVCKQRDVKGLYAKAIRGEISNFTGVQGEYEEPLCPDIVVRTDEDSIEECVNQILTLHNSTPKALLIGRWQPLHEGHKWLIEQVQKMGHDVLLGIRNTPINKDGPYSAQERIDMIQKMFNNSVDHIILPDIIGVYYGRGVGYEVKELQPPKDIATISATKIRERR